MSAPEIAYRLACAPLAAIGGASAQHVALAVACRWAQPDGRFIVRQTAIAAATGLSESSVLRAVKALRSARVFVPIGVDECRIVTAHLPDADGSSRPADGRNRQEPAGRVTAGAVPQTAGAVSDRPPMTSRDTRPATGPTVTQTAPTVPQTAAAVTGTESVSPLIDVSVSLPPNSNMEGGDLDARAGEAPPAGPSPSPAGADAAGDPFTELEERQLAWLAARGALLVNPSTGELLGRQWLRLTAGLGVDLVKRILAVRLGDFPSDFRKASEAFATQVEAARRAGADAEAERLMAEARRGEAAVRAQEQAKQAENLERERGPYLEQARVLLAEIAAADPRLLVLADSGFAGALVRLRSDVAACRVSGLNLVHIRTEWPAVRARKLPADPPPPAAEAPAQRSFSDPSDPEPVAP